MIKENDINSESGIETFPYRHSEGWCDLYLVDLVYGEIVESEFTRSQVDVHPYLKMSTFEYIPDFCIKKSDLSSKVVRALMGYDEEDRKVVLRHVGAQIFARHYHKRISKLLKVRLIA